MRKKKSAKKYNIEVQIDKIFNELFKSEVKENQLKKIEPNCFISDFKSQAEQIICPICLLIPLNPIQCKKCDNIVCEECMNKNSKCAICRDIFEKKLDKCLFRMIEKMKLNCPNSKNCDKIYFSEYKNHLLNCEYGKYSCLTCNTIFTNSKEDCRKHALICGYSDVKCVYCSKIIKLYQKKDHELKCGEEEIKCNLCKNFVKNKNLLNHQKNECEMRIVRCKKCNFEYTYKELKSHNSDKCKDNQILYWKNLYFEEKKKNEEKKEEEQQRNQIKYTDSPLMIKDYSFDDNKPYLSERSYTPLNKHRGLYPSKSYEEFLQFNNYLKTNVNKSSKKFFNSFCKFEEKIENKIIIESSILEEEDKYFLFKCFQKNEIKFPILYKLSKDGGSDAFHKKCDKKGPTLVLFKIEEQDIRFGGFTSVSWDSVSKEKYDDKAFIFSLNNQKIFKTTNSKSSIYCHSYYGPFFGGNSSQSRAELWVGKNKGGGLYNSNVYKDKDRECSQGLRDFQLEEIEVFLVVNT